MRDRIRYGDGKSWRTNARRTLPERLTTFTAKTVSPPLVPLHSQRKLCFHRACQMPRICLPCHRLDHRRKALQPLMVEVVTEKNIHWSRYKKLEKLAIVEWAKIFDAADVDVLVERVQMPAWSFFK